MTPAATILVAGAINTDLVATMHRAPAAGETVTGTGFAIHGGGKGANQAVAAARSGASVALLGATGNDEFGRARRADLERDGIDTGAVMLAADASSGVALIFVEERGENRIAYVPGATLAVSRSHALAALERCNPAWLLATNELPPSSLIALFAAARDRGATVVLNATPDPELVPPLLPSIDILIVNEIEAAALLGEPDVHDWPAAARALQRRGTEIVALTAGEHGAVVATPGQLLERRPPAVGVVDTTGAGDTFCGAFVAGLARGESLHDSLDQAVLASALSVTRAGAQSSIPTRGEVEAWVAGKRPGSPPAS